MNTFNSAEVMPSSVAIEVDTELRGELTEMHEALNKSMIRAAELFKFIKEFNEYANEFIMDLDDPALNEKWGHLIDGIVAPYGVYLTGIEQEFEVEVEVSGTMTTYKTLIVSAVSQNAANDLVTNDPDVYFDSDEVLSEATQSVGWDNIEVGIA